MFSRWRQRSEATPPPVDDETSASDRTGRYFYPMRELAEPIHIVCDSGEEITVFSVPVNPVDRRDLSDLDRPTAAPNDAPASSRSDIPRTAASGKVHWSRTWKRTQNDDSSNLADGTQTLDRPAPIADNQNTVQSNGCDAPAESSGHAPRPDPPQT